MSTLTRIADVLGDIAADVVVELVPGGGHAVNLLNTFLPDDMKLGSKATGADVKAGLDRLSPEQHSILMSKKIELSIAKISAERDVTISKMETAADMTKAMFSAEKDSNKFTGRAAAMMLCLIMVFIIEGGVVVTWILAKQIPSFELVLAMLYFPTSIVKQWFGMRQDEQRDIMSMSNGQPIQQKTKIMDVVTAKLMK